MNIIKSPYTAANITSAPIYNQDVKLKFSSTDGAIVRVNYTIQ